MDNSVKEDVKCKNTPGIKHPENLRHYEEGKSPNDNNRGRRRNSDEKYRKYFLENHRGIFPKPKVGGSCKCIRGIQNTE